MTHNKAIEMAICIYSHRNGDNGDRGACPYCHQYKKSSMWMCNNCHKVLFEMLGANTLVDVLNAIEVCQCVTIKQVKRYLMMRKLEC